MQDARSSSRQQYLYLASELNAAGMMAGTISAIKFTVTGFNYVDPADPIDNLNFKIGTTSASSLRSTSWEPGTLPVYTAATYLPVMGANTFTFTTPFFWNGTDNIVIELCTDNTDAGGTTANTLVEMTTGLSFNASHSTAENFQGSLCNATDKPETGTTANRPNITFSWAAAPACSAATLTGGTAVAAKPEICSGESVYLKLDGASLASALSYQWQSSADRNVWTNIAGATAPAGDFTQTATTYYRAVLTCASGGTAISADVRVGIPQPIAGTFTINKNQPAGNGNFQSFNDAYNHIRCGINGPVVFNVAAGSGVYNERLILNRVAGTSEVNTITFNGNAGASIAFSETVTADRATIKLDGADYFVFNNLAVTSSGSSYAIGFQLVNDADSNTIRNCTITSRTTGTNNGYGGVFIGGTVDNPFAAVDASCDGNIVEGSTITGGSYGITIAGSTTAAARFNKLLRNRIIDFGVSGIRVTLSSNTIIDSNFISRPTRTNQGNPLTGIYFNATNTRLSVTKNTITNMYQGRTTLNAFNNFYGIYFDVASGLSTFPNVVENNLIYNINGGPNLYGIYSNSTNNVFFQHNTIVLDGPVPASDADIVNTGFYLSGGAGVVFKNNNIAVTRGGPGIKTAIWFANNLHEVQCNRNNLYAAAGIGRVSLGYMNGTYTQFLNEWQAATGQDAASVAVDPLFENAATGNMKPTQPALDNIGENLSVATDITGLARSNTPDPGAFEFTTPPCATPPTPGVAALNKSTICVDLTVLLTITGNTSGASQTYQLESSLTETGTYQPAGSVSTSPEFSFAATETKYYRVKVTCGAQVSYTNAVLLTVFQAFPSQTYTINKTQPASATNFTSFAAAYGALECGIAGPIVFDVASGSGPYEERIIFGKVKGASATNTITFRGNGNIIKPTGATSGQRAVIKLQDATHFIFDNFVIDATGSTTYGYGVHLLNADSNTVKNSTILSSTTSSSSTNFAGIVISNSHEDPIDEYTNQYYSDGNVFENNTIRGGYYGITLAGHQRYDANYDEFIHNNKVLGNKIEDFYQTGIYIVGTGETIIERNEISRPARTSVGGFNGLHFSGTNGSASVNANRIFTPFGGNPASTSTFNGLLLEYTGTDQMMNWPIVISNNLIHRIKSAGTQNGVSSEMGIAVKYYHNTISLDDASNQNAAATSGFRVSNANLATEIVNNMVSITRGGTGTKIGLNIVSGDVVPLSFVDYNNYYINGVSGNNHIGYRNANRTTLDEWKAILRVKEQHSTSINPIYADTATGNFSPTILPVDNTGTPVNISRDINGKARDASKPDIGAFEFTASSCISGVRAGDAVASPATGICMGAKITLNLDRATSSGSQTTVWQSAPTATGPWTTISEPLYTNEFVTRLARDHFFRAYITCMNVTDTSSVTGITTNGALPAGTYTIKKDGSGNYQSFNQAVSAMACGIEGAVTFVVSPGSYRERLLIKGIPGADAASRVTFKSATNAADVKLSELATSANNYVLMLDSASYITFDNITIEADDATVSRAVVLAGTSSYDSIINNVIVSGVATAANTNKVGIYAAPGNFKQIVIAGNTVRNGASAIYLEGSSLLKGEGLAVNGNTITQPYQYGIYTTYWNNAAVNDNVITLSGAGTTYGTYNRYHSGLLSVSGNKVTISNKSGIAYGLYIANSDIPNADNYTIQGNKVIAATSNTSSLYGMYISAVSYAGVVNNVIYLNTSSTTSYGLYNTNSRSARYYNNTVYNTSASGTNNYAGYFTDNGVPVELRYRVDVMNNVFANDGNGKALYINSYELFNSDYNLLYAKGSVLVQNGTSNPVATLQDWRALSGLDINSISTATKPALLTSQDLAPDVAAPDVWIMQGRGAHIFNNGQGINGVKRATLLKEGVPDLGAYEFTPTSQPPAAVPYPAVPAAGTRQYFMMATDTVAAVTWGNSVPTGITVRRFTGTVPPSIPAGKDYMYFYTEATPAAAGNYDFTMEQFYLKPWRGFVDDEERIRLGRTEQAGTWRVDAQSGVNTVANIISQPSVTFLDKFTGLTDPTVSYPVTDTLSRMDSATKGTRFWVGFGQSYMGYSVGVDEFVVVMGGADKDAKVTVRINGTSWSKTYDVPANTYMLSDPVPKTGVSGALLYTEGLSQRGISINSDVPINAFVRGDNMVGSPITGSTLLYPVASYGYEYYTMSYRQDNMFDENAYCWFYVIADHDNTKVQIVPSNPTVGGRKAGVPFEVVLNKGEVYQVLGAVITSDMSQDLSGSYVRSLSNSDGQCYPVAVFSGSGRSFIGCDAEYFSVLGGQYLIQQNMPTNAWGQEYLTAPASSKEDPSVPQTFVYRVMVKDPSTVVRVNGTPLANPVNNYYTFYSNTADVITGDKPIMVTQYMANSDYQCGLSGGGGEMFTVVAAKNGIKKAVFPRMERGIAGAANQVTLMVIIPTSGLASLKIDGSSSFSHTYAHQNKPGYSIVVKKWPAEDGISVVESDSLFTAVLYGMGGINSYGFHLGYTLPNRINSGLRNVYDSTGHFSAFNCVGTPFRHSVLLPSTTSRIVWQFSKVASLSPASDVVQTDPVADSTVIIDGEVFYQYTVKTPYTFSKEGTYIIPIEYKDDLIGNCSNTVQRLVTVKVVASPQAGIELSHSGCLNEEALFTPVVTTADGDAAEKYKWDLGDGSDVFTRQVAHLYNKAGDYVVKLQALTRAGCIAEASRNITIKDVANVRFATDTVKSCEKSTVTLAVLNPQPGAVYNWYSTETGGTAIHTGATYTLNDLAGIKDYYVEGVWNGCTSKPRTRITTQAWPLITAPVINVDTVGTNMFRISWLPVEHVTAYQVSIDGGNTWAAPSSGSSGLTHTVVALESGKAITIQVKAVDPNHCSDKESQVQVTTRPEQIFVPNAFTPNGDSRNDFFKIEGYLIQSMRLHIFNQWGQQIYESADLNGWDGKYKGEYQPSGVYIYVAEITLKDGSKTVKKGSVNLIR
ncbi:right-handed parallel beta-helix repeat-containing protein [Filimonas effusa]|nr:gliding motility-associated C-terminal domain-containing protein [Filimonas effusa]